MMRNILCLLLTICVFLSLAALPVTAEDTLPVHKLVTLGDSITEGYGLPGFSAGSGNYGVATYGSIVGAALGCNPGESYLNLAVSGHTSADLCEVIAASGEQLRGATLVCISIGGNDILHAAYAADYAVFGQNGVMAALLPGYPGTEAGQVQRGEVELASMLKILGAQMKQDMPGVYAEYRENIVAAIAGIREVAPNSRIILQTVYDPFLCTDPTAPNVMALQSISAVDTAFIVGMNELIRSLAAALSFEVVDVYGVFTAAGGHPMTNILQNDIHPNEKGHETIAALVLGTVLPSQADDPAKEEPTTSEDASSETSADIPSGQAGEEVSSEASEKMPSEGEPSEPGTEDTDGGAWKKWLGCGLIAIAAVGGCAAVVLIYRKKKK